MIEREFIVQKTKEYYIKQYIENKLKGVGISQIKLKKIPLGEKIILYTSRPSLLVGSKGANIRDLTKVLKKEFHLENPQIEINEVKDVFLDAKIVAERIASSLERYGSARFKSIGHKVMENVLNSGALGVEVLVSGKIPGARAKRWRFYQGYLKKCGDIAVVGVRKACTTAVLKTGVVGIQVAIMPPDLILPDYVGVINPAEQGPVTEVTSEDMTSDVQDETGAAKKVPVKKKTERSVDKSEGKNKERVPRKVAPRKVDGKAEVKADSKVEPKVDTKKVKKVDVPVDSKTAGKTEEKVGVDVNTKVEVDMDEKVELP